MQRPCACFLCKQVMSQIIMVDRFTVQKTFQHRLFITIFLHHPVKTDTSQCEGKTIFMVYFEKNFFSKTVLCSSKDNNTGSSIHHPSYLWVTESVGAEQKPSYSSPHQCPSASEGCQDILCSLQQMLDLPRGLLPKTFQTSLSQGKESNTK